MKTVVNEIIDIFFYKKPSGFENFENWLTANKSFLIAEEKKQITSAYKDGFEAANGDDKYVLMDATECEEYFDKNYGCEFNVGDEVLVDKGINIDVEHAKIIDFDRKANGILYAIVELLYDNDLDVNQKHYQWPVRINRLSKKV